MAQNNHLYQILIIFYKTISRDCKWIKNNKVRRCNIRRDVRIMCGREIKQVLDAQTYFIPLVFLGFDLG
jgi:hypothetical protein